MILKNKKNVVMEKYFNKFLTDILARNFTKILHTLLFQNIYVCNFFYVHPKFSCTKNAVLKGVIKLTFGKKIF